MRELTGRQREALDSIRGSLERLGRAPTVRELGTALGITHGSTWELLHALERKGFIRRDRFTSRGIRVTAGGPPPVSIEGDRVVVRGPVPPLTVDEAFALANDLHISALDLARERREANGQARQEGTPP